MAWRSSGRSNTELARNLRTGALILTDQTFEAFTRIDRGDFVPHSHRESAYRDEPFHCEGGFHLSAPHIYASVVEALDLDDSVHSFLNLGSGTGYLSFLVAARLDRQHHSIGVEINADLVEFAASRAALVKHLAPFNYLRFIHGDVFSVEVTEARFDRIYVGAGARAAAVDRVRYLLTIQGILIAPRDDELVKIRRISENEFVSVVLSNVRFSGLVENVNVSMTPPLDLGKGANANNIGGNELTACKIIRGAAVAISRAPS